MPAGDGHRTGRGAADTEQTGYKRLINCELSRQVIPVAHMADRLGVLRTKLHKVLRQGAHLDERLRLQLFEQLQIDHTRATIAISLLRSHLAYYDQAVFLAAEGLKGLYCEARSAKQGAIQIDLQPVIIHTAAERTYAMLMVHQTRVLEANQTLFC
ncbi:hypothetical protein C7W88_17100 (plasmid) [Novosphingobium sp. THN1]|nr:hypothetical protein C7W88_17100 [Novosphingobium sp. THN1]